MAIGHRRRTRLATPQGLEPGAVVSAQRRLVPRQGATISRQLLRRIVSTILGGHLNAGLHEKASRVYCQCHLKTIACDSDAGRARMRGCVHGSHSGRSVR